MLDSAPMIRPAGSALSASLETVLREVVEVALWVRRRCGDSAPRVYIRASRYSVATASVAPSAVCTATWRRRLWPSATAVSTTASSVSTM